MNLTSLEKALIRHEGCKRFSYQDSLGNITIGCGRNIDARTGLGLSFEEIIYLLRNDINRVEVELMQFSWFRHIESQTRREALIEFVFNIGFSDFLKFKKTIRALVDQNYNKAANEMLNSLWFEQVGERARHIADRVRGHETDT